jgi:hypothetical protein
LLDSPLGQNPFYIIFGFILQNDHLLYEFCSQTKLNKRNCWNFGKKMFDGRSNVANGKEKENGHRMNGGTIGIGRKMDSNVFGGNARGEHPNYCLFGTLHLVVWKGIGNHKIKLLGKLSKKEGSFPFFKPKIFLLKGCHAIVGGHRSLCIFGPLRAGGHSFSTSTLCNGHPRIRHSPLGIGHFAQ